MLIDRGTIGISKPTQKRKRRGVILSPSGLQRLREAQEQFAITGNNGYAYTQEQLSILTQLSVRSITRLQSCKVAVDRQTLEEFFRTFELTLTEQDYFQPEAVVEEPIVKPIAQDWGEALDVSHFYGRGTELTALTDWIVQRVGQRFVQDCIMKGLKALFCRLLSVSKNAF